MKSLSLALCLSSAPVLTTTSAADPPPPTPAHAPLSVVVYGHGLNLISKFAFVSGYAALRFCRYAQIPHKSFEPAHEQLLWTTTTTMTTAASALFSLLLLPLLLLLLLFKRSCFGCRFTHQQIVEFIGGREGTATRGGGAAGALHCAGRGAAFSILSLHWRGVPVCGNRRHRPQLVTHLPPTQHQPSPNPNPNCNRNPWPGTRS